MTEISNSLESNQHDPARRIDVVTGARGTETCDDCKGYTKLISDATTQHMSFPGWRLCKCSPWDFRNAIERERDELRYAVDRLLHKTKHWFPITEGTVEPVKHIAPELELLHALSRAAEGDTP